MRRLAFDKLIAWKSGPNRKPLILQGARQVGKTYLLNQFAKDHFIDSYYLNFEENPKLKKIFSEDLLPERILQDIGLELKTAVKNNRNSLLVLDEIQACPEALTSLKYFSEKNIPIAICAAGSLLGLQLNSGSFPVGKVDTLTLYPLTFSEFISGIDEPQLAELLSVNRDERALSELAHQKLWEKLKIYFVTGGLPEAINVFKRESSDLFTALTATRTKQREIAGNYLNDIAKHSGKLNALHIESVWQSIHRQLGRSLDDSVKRFRFKDAVAGAGKFERLVGPIDWLSKAKLALKVPIASSAQQPISAFCQENIFKLFYFDIGILGCLSNLQPETILEYTYGTYKGFFAENFVAQEFSAYGHTLVSWNEGTSEIEFILERNGKTIPVEVKSGNAVKAKSLGVFLKKYHPQNAIILSGAKLDLTHTTKYYPLYCCQWI